MPTLLEARANDVVDAEMAWIVPQRMQPMAEWLVEHWRDRYGNRFNKTQVPWVTAPEGPCDAVDNPQYNEIWLQWAARTFKTTFGQAMLSRRAHQAPCMMMFATRNEELCKRVIRRYWHMLDNTPELKHHLPIERFRNATRVNFTHNTAEIIGTWAGSKSGLADESIPVGAANEVDKWEHASTSTEGDPLPRFLKRGGEWPDRKFLIESTPGEEGHSRVERGRLIGTNHRYMVPCPHCGYFQEIVFGNGKEPPGIFWDKPKSGVSELTLARKTAHYVCGNPGCHKRIHDVHQFEMSNRGVWVPEGCEVDHDRAMQARDLPQFDRSWLIGEPARDGNIYSSQLSVFHALFHGYGEMAVDFLRKREKEADRRQWLNEEAGLTWSRQRRTQKWRELYARICDRSLPPSVVPVWASMLTAAIDRQKDFFVWAVFAWGPGNRHHLVEYGDAESLEAIRAEILSHEYQHEDGEGGLRIAFTLVDNGYRPDSAVEEFCLQSVTQHGIHVWTCEGSEGRLKFDVEERQKPRAKPGHEPQPRDGMVFYAVDTWRTQEWIEKLLHARQLGDPGSGSIHAADVEQHQDLLEQLLNEELKVKQTATGHESRRWERVNSDIPNDYRDIWRYAFCAMLAERRGRAIPRRGEQPVVRRAVVTVEGGRKSEW